MSEEKLLDQTHVDEMASRASWVMKNDNFTSHDAQLACDVSALIADRSTLRATLQAQEARADKAEGEVERLRKQVSMGEIKTRYCETYHAFCADCRDKLEPEKCHRCYWQKLQLKLETEKAAREGFEKGVTDEANRQLESLKSQVAGLRKALEAAKTTLEFYSIRNADNHFIEPGIEKITQGAAKNWYQVDGGVKALQALRIIDPALKSPETLSQSYKEEVLKQGAEVERRTNVAVMETLLRHFSKAGNSEFSKQVVLREIRFYINIMAMGDYQQPSESSLKPHEGE